MNTINDERLNNKDIRLYARGSGVPFWKIAKAMGKSEPTFTRLMREELPEEKKTEIKNIIDRLYTEGE